MDLKMANSDFTTVLFVLFQPSLWVLFQQSMLCFQPVGEPPWMCLTPLNKTEIILKAHLKV